MLELRAAWLSKARTLLGSFTTANPSAAATIAPTTTSVALCGTRGLYRPARSLPSLQDAKVDRAACSSDRRLVARRCGRRDRGRAGARGCGSPPAPLRLADRFV